jgi:hypothetical protein
MNRPLCFVLMPLGKKHHLAGALVDFDAVYRNFIAPVVESAGLEPLRAVEDFTEDLDLKPLFEQLTLCPFALADLTFASANLYYELGVRQARRPGTTVMLYSDNETTPLSPGALNVIPYSLTADGTPADVTAPRQALTRGLEEVRRSLRQGRFADSAIYQLVEEFPEIAHTKTDVFRERVRYSAEKKQRLAAAREAGLEALRELEKSFEPVHALESAVAVETVMVQEQLALAESSGEGC